MYDFTNRSCSVPADFGIFEQREKSFCVWQCRGIRSNKQRFCDLRRFLFNIVPTGWEKNTYPYPSSNSLPPCISSNRSIGNFGCPETIQLLREEGRKTFYAFVHNGAKDMVNCFSLLLTICLVDVPQEKIPEENILVLGWNCYLFPQSRYTSGE